MSTCASLAVDSHLFSRGCLPVYRKAALEAGLVVAVVAALRSVIRSQATTWSIPLLQPVAIGVLIGAGYVFDKPHDGAARGFNCSLSWVWRLAKQQNWRFKKPFGDARKEPPNAVRLGLDIMLRLTYLVWKWKIPKELVVNADQTGECVH